MPIRTVTSSVPALRPLVPGASGSHRKTGGQQVLQETLSGLNVFYAGRLIIYLCLVHCH